MEKGDRLSVESIAHTYSVLNGCVTIKVYDASNGKTHFIRGGVKVREPYCVTYDPERKLRVGQYVDSYYCNTLKELNEIVAYLDNEIRQEGQQAGPSEDVLDLKDTKRCFYLDKEIDN